jgi:uncharacterized protein (DUF302 family)
MASSASGAAGDGLVRVRSAYPIKESVARIEAALVAANITVFAFIDHDGEAESVGLGMRPTKLIIFGSPKGGTPLMVATPSVAIDLPLKALLAEDNDGVVWLSYNSPEYLRARHGFPEELVKNIAGAGGLLEKAVK